MMLLYEQETGAIINACMAVHNELGNGFLEAVYQDALEIEFQDRNIPFVREAKIPIFYKGRQISKEYYADFICYGKMRLLRNPCEFEASHPLRPLHALPADSQSLISSTI